MRLPALLLLLASGLTGCGGGGSYDPHFGEETWSPPFAGFDMTGDRWLGPVNVDFAIRVSEEIST